MTKDIRDILWYQSLSQKDRDLVDALDRLKNKKTVVRTEERDISPTFRNELIQALRKTKFNAKAENTLKLARAGQLPIARLDGKLKAYASKSNPLATDIELVLTPLGIANGNGQGVKRSEVNNIISSALYMPIKIAYDGEINGHVGSVAIGTITDVRENTDSITGAGLLWNTESPETIDFLKSQAELYTSFEIYYSSVERDSAGVSWLIGCVFAGSCIVSNPAFNKNQTRARIV